MTAPLAALLLGLLPADAPPAPAEVPLGARIDNLSFKDIRYLSRSLDDFPKAKAFVLVFTSTGCPLVPRYFPALKRLDRDYRGKGVQMLAVNAAPDDLIVDMAAQAVEHEVEFPFVKDLDGTVVRALGVKRTPEVVLLDGQRRLRYRGRIDDQYRPGVTRPAPTRHDLKEALDEVLAGKEVSVPSTLADGCLITLPGSGKPEQPVTYTEHVEPILRKHCQQCHRPGTPAPFGLMTYQQAQSRADSLAEVVREGRMPPWHSAPQYDTFANRRGLNAAERERIVQWARAGAPRGPEAAEPKREPAPKWQIGEPDLVLTTAPYDLPAEGDVAYQYAVLSHVFLADTWVQGVQILPENRRTVHHCNMAYITLGQSFKVQNFITGFVPGGEAMNLEPGVAFKIPAGSVLGLQIHFVTTGKVEKMRVSVGLRYARGQVEQQLRHVRLVNTRFAIPPGAPAHPVSDGWVLDHDAVGVGLFTHMHVRGKAMTFRAHRPDGKSETLLMIPNYSFDWQQAYRWEPGKMRWPRGTRLECVALYDNSAFNPYNPDPQATVRDGPQTYHEMMNGFVFYLRDGEKLGLEIDPRTGRVKE
jgi:hypothetical protein